MDAEEPNPSGTGALSQGTVIPLGWKPTAQQPVPVIRCVVIKKDGTRCGRWSIRGHTKCMSHLKGALNFPNVRAHIDGVIEAARLRIVDSSDEAIDTLHELMEPGTPEAIRLKAATEILDRAGIRGGFEIDVEVTDTTNPAEVLTKRLQQLRTRQISESNLVEPHDVIPGSVLPSQPFNTPAQQLEGQDTLF